MQKLLALLFLLLSFPAYANPPIGSQIASTQTATAAGSIVLKAAAGVLTGFSVTSSSTTAGYVMVFDSATVPSDGTVTPKFCYYLTAPGTVAASWLQYPVPFANGISVVFSSTGCYTKTISNTGFFMRTGAMI